LKKSLIGLIIIIFIVGLGWWGFNRVLKPDPQIEAQLREEFGAEFFDDFTFQEVQGAPVESAGLIRIYQQNEEYPGKDLNANDPGEAFAAPNGEEEIVRQYVPKFQALEYEANKRLDELFAAAMKEYRQQKGRGNSNIAELARKYIQAGSLLEANVDSQFSLMLTSMEADLIANQQSTVMIEEIQKEYNHAKAKKRADILERARR